MMSGMKVVTCGSPDWQGHEHLAARAARMHVEAYHAENIQQRDKAGEALYEIRFAHGTAKISISRIFSYLCAVCIRPDRHYNNQVNKQ